MAGDETVKMVNTSPTNWKRSKSTSKDGKTTTTGDNDSGPEDANDESDTNTPNETIPLQSKVDKSTSMTMYHNNSNSANKEVKNQYAFNH